jgi:DNA-binding winged helix-turn-helix (wHTH) protein/TolB-like protein
MSFCLCNNPVRKMNSGRFKFGLFEFDVVNRELRREGVFVRLQPQPAQVLSCLILRAGQTISREELCQAVWGAETFVDFDRGLNYCIAEIRSALGDDSAAPRYLRTIPRHGYQFIAPIEQMSEHSQRTQTIPGLRGLVPKKIGVACTIGVLLGIALGAGYWIHSSRKTRPLPIVAVVRFDNETNDADMNRFSDGLTDTLVQQLTSMSQERYGVIGNAAILRLPRDQRDLNAISSSLHAGYVVLGQVQSSGLKTRVLAHLIRMPDQTHLWVARVERSFADPLSFESETAEKIADEFSQRLVKDSGGDPLPPAPNE